MITASGAFTLTVTEKQIQMMKPVVEALLATASLTASDIPSPPVFKVKKGVDSSVEITGTALPHATIHLWIDDKYYGDYMADALGRFEIHEMMVMGATHSIRLFQEVDDVPSVLSDAVFVHISPVSYGTLSGYVYVETSTGSKPVFAKVSLKNEEYELYIETETSTSGYFEFTDIPALNYTLAVEIGSTVAYTSTVNVDTSTNTIIHIDIPYIN